MDIFTQVSNLMPKQNYHGTNGVGQQQVNTSKIQPSNNASKHGSASEIDDVVSISGNAQNRASKDFAKSSGSIGINNNRIKYSLNHVLPFQSI
ncbi:MAG: hypothetical protein V3U15_02495 [Nitrospinota bacterium]